MVKRFGADIETAVSIVKHVLDYFFNDIASMSLKKFQTHYRDVSLGESVPILNISSNN